MIKALVLDIDGVIVGDQPGFNMPLPHPIVLARLSKVFASGIPVCLSTGKGRYAVQPVAEAAGLATLHSADNGALIVQGTECSVVKEHQIPPETVLELITYLQQYIDYIELYTADDYFLQKNSANTLTDRHTEILKKSPILVDDLKTCVQGKTIVRVTGISDNGAKIESASKHATQFATSLHLTTTSHPYLDPQKILLWTPVDISKESALYEISDYIHIPPEEILGVGDNMQDWQFIKDCGYKATLANASEELKECIRGAGDGGFIAPSVNDHGIIAILDHFELP